MRNYYINEAAESLKKTDKIKKDLKKKLNTCKLSNFKSEPDCSDFYSVFFCNALPEDYIITATEWFGLYSDLLNEKTFYSNLVYFVGYWKPSEYGMMFKGLRNLINQELEVMKTSRTQYLGQMCSNMEKLYNTFNAIYITLRKDLIQPDLMVFAKTIVTVLDQYTSEISNLMHKELRNDEKTDQLGLKVYVRDEDYISEDATEFISSLQTLCDMLDETFNKTLDEGIVSKAKDVANLAQIKERRVVDFIDRNVYKAYNNWRKRKETKNHEQMMGETLRISRLIKQAFGVYMTWKIFNPIAGIITALVTTAIDQRTKRDDRMKILNDIKDELEIVNEKINIAERNNDDKSRIEMIRIRQKLYREYERISGGMYHKNDNR